MRYLNHEDIEALGRDWPELCKVISKAVDCLKKQDYSQPLKPYLRYGDLKNRLIAMPAFVGGEIEASGIKWISSFPANIEKGLKRAHSVTILNNTNTGEPICTINTSLISGIRTAAVSGLLISKYHKSRKIVRGYKIGMTGFGPIGQLHLEMVTCLLNGEIEEVRIYDLKGVDRNALPKSVAQKTIICSSYEEAFEDAHIFITATVASERYICMKPRIGSLHLNISLRDYRSDFIRFVDKIIVDNWEEVCRENTDIEVMHLREGLKKEHTIDLIDVLWDGAIDRIRDNEVLMFNPMGMAVFDIAMAKYYYQLSKKLRIGSELPD